LFTIDPTTALILKKHPHRVKDIVQSFNHKQIKCKQWLVEQLTELDLLRFDRISIVGSWYGQVILPMLDPFLCEDIRLYDVDEETIKIAKMYHRDDERVKCTVKNANGITFSGSNKLVINTSCEHMDPLSIKKSIVALQSNNYRGIEGHINCVDSAEELIHQYNLSDVYYTGELEFENYTRFMVIGRAQIK
jgi:hypothetical protein